MRGASRCHSLDDLNAAPRDGFDQTRAMPLEDTVLTLGTEVTLWSINVYRCLQMFMAYFIVFSQMKSDSGDKFDAQLASSVCRGEYSLVSSAIRGWPRTTGCVVVVVAVVALLLRTPSLSTMTLCECLVERIFLANNLKCLQTSKHSLYITLLYEK